jgi:hypothetical protein
LAGEAALFAIRFGIFCAAMSLKCTSKSSSETSLTLRLSGLMRVVAVRALQVYKGNAIAAFPPYELLSFDPQSGGRIICWGVYAVAVTAARIFDPRTHLRSTGIWFTDEDNALRLVIREGDRLAEDEPARVRTLNILERVSGSPSQTRSFNAKGALIYRAALFGGKQAIMQSNIPGTWSD